MAMKLFWSAIGKFALGVLLVGLLVFVLAGILEYRQGWRFMGILFVFMFLVVIVMMVKNPERLRRVKKKKELPDNWFTLTLGLNYPLASPRVQSKPIPIPDDGQPTL